MLKDDQIFRFAEAFGVNEVMLRDMMELHLTEETINEFGKYDKLKATVDIEKARKYFKEKIFSKSGLNFHKANRNHRKSVRQKSLIGHDF